MFSDSRQYLAYTQVIHDLKKGKLLPLYFAKGADYYLYKQFIRDLQAAFKAQYGDQADLQQRWGIDLKAATDVSSLMSGGGLFSSASLVLLHEIQDAGKSVKTNLARLLSNPSPGTVILVHYSVSDFRKAKWLTDIQNVAQVVHLSTPVSSTLPQIVAEIAGNYQLKLSEDAIHRLIEQSGGELAIIDNELEKLSIYLDDVSREVGPALIDEVSGSLENAQVSQFIDAVSARDHKKAIQTLVEIHRRGKEGFPFLVSLLYKRLIQLMTLQENYNARKSIGQGITSYYFLKDLEPFTSKYTLAELQSATRELADLDYQFRLGSMDMLCSFTAWVSKVV